MTKVSKQLVLLDVHAILHRAYHALPGFTSSKGEPTGALYGLSAFLIKLIGELRPEYIIACYDLPGPTFRKKLYEDYKAGRAKTDEDLIKQMIKSRDVFKAFNIPIYEKPGFEADDMIGTISEITKKEKDIQTIIASGDMDTLQLVSGDKVVVYTLKKGINDTVVYNEIAVRERYGFGPEQMADYKGLRGDPSDNIIGVKGIGEKTGTELIKNFGSIENIYKKIEKDPESLLKVGIKPRIIDLLREAEEEAKFSKMLATIKRDVAINFSIPNKTWKESVDLAETSKMFQEFEFRTLGPRLENILGAVDSKLINTEAKDQSVPVVSINSQEFRRLQIASWLLNSELTNPTTEDILELSGRENLFEAEKYILNEIKKRGLEKVYFDIELPIISIIKEAETRGIVVYKTKLQQLSGEYHEKLKEFEKKIWSHAGSEFNINSPKQLGEILFDKMNLTAKGLRKTAGGARSTKESELLKLQDSHPIISDILSYREIQKLVSTYIDALPSLIDMNGRIHTSLNQMGTTTGRMSSNNPNLQNIPAKGEMAKDIRRAFVASHGFDLVAFDYSQIEMRVLAWLSGDKALGDIFKKGQDIHTEVASRVFGVPDLDVTKDMRRKAKVINFGIVYGMGVSSLKKNLNSTMEEAETFYENFFKQFPKIRDYFDKVKNDARKLGYTTTAYGRRRQFPMINSSLPFVRAEAERMAINAPIQGTATADIIKMAMRDVDSKLNELNLHDSAQLVLQVHDELIYEVKKDARQDEAIKLIKETMENVGHVPVPLVVNVAIGQNWGDLATVEI